MLNAIRNIKLDSETCWKLSVVACLSGMFLMVPELAIADDEDGGAIADALCRISNALTGKIGRGIATIGVVMLGIGLFLGKLSWGLAVAVGIGIAGIFGATSIINWMDGDGTDQTCDEAAADEVAG